MAGAERTRVRASALEDGLRHAASGTSGGPTSASASGAPSARTTAPTARRGTTSPTTTPARGVPLGRGRHGRLLRHRAAPVPRAGALERARPDPQGADVRAHRPQGNHGEDVKEYWWYLDAIPSHAWNRWRYHYPQATRTTTSSPRTVGGASSARSTSCSTPARSTRTATGWSRYYAKAGPADLLMSPGDQRRPRPRDAPRAADGLVPQHVVVGVDAAPPAPAARRRRDRHRPPVPGALELLAGNGPDGTAPLLFCENETNAAKLFDAAVARRTPRTGSATTC